jgi:hypothetical protein
MTVDIRDGVCAYLQGGFGNQLFILVAAWQQSVRLDCPLYVDASRFIARDPLDIGPETPWPYQLESLTLPGQVLTTDSPWFRNSPRRPRVVRSRRRSFPLTVFSEDPKEFAAINTIRPGTTIFGYFQSPHYFDGISDQVRSLVTSAALTPAERTAIGNAEADPRVTVHLRRGDYLGQQARDHHGLTESAYVHRAIALLQRLLPDVSPRVFSDSPELAREELADMADAQFVDDDPAIGPLATIRCMAAGTGFIMSNSSFSWWSAWLNDRGDRPVIAPRPWTASGSSASELLLPEWITLG